MLNGREDIIFYVLYLSVATTIIVTNDLLTDAFNCRRRRGKETMSSHDGVWRYFPNYVAKHLICPDIVNDACFPGYYAQDQEISSSVMY